MVSTNIKKKKQQYSLEELKARLDGGLDVFEHYYPQFTGLGLGKLRDKMKSPFLRGGQLETNPSFSIYRHNLTGEVYFMDHAFEKKGGCWQFVMDLFGLDFKEAVDKVRRDMLNDLSVPERAVTRVYHKVPLRKSTRVELIPGYRDFIDSDLEWFADAGISKKTLHVAGVSAATHYDMVKENKTVRIVARTPMYVIDFPSGRRKIYQPHGDPRFKWTSNTDASEDVFLFSHIPKEGDDLFLIGGNRDAMSFMQNIGHPAIALASESANGSEGLISFIKRQFKRVWVLYDNDKQGYAKAEKFEVEHGFKPLNHIYQEFAGTNKEGRAKDFVDMYQNNEDAIRKFEFYLSQNM